MLYDMTTSRNFHIPLPEEVYQSLREVSKQLGQPATKSGRDAIEDWLLKQRKRQLHGAIRAYAETYAGTETDLDPELEAAGIESLSTIEDREHEAR